MRIPDNPLFAALFDDTNPGKLWGRTQQLLGMNGGIVAVRLTAWKAQQQYGIAATSGYSKNQAAPHPLRHPSVPGS